MKINGIEYTTIYSFERVKADSYDMWHFAYRCKKVSVDTTNYIVMKDGVKFAIGKNSRSEYNATILGTGYALSWKFESRLKDILKAIDDVDTSKIIASKEAILKSKEILKNTDTKERADALGIDETTLKVIIDAELAENRCLCVLAGIDDPFVSEESIKEAEKMLEIKEPEADAEVVEAEETEVVEESIKKEEVNEMRRERVDVNTFAGKVKRLGKKLAVKAPTTGNTMLDDIASTIVGCDFSMKGTWAWASGDTRAHKEELKKLGFYFSGKRKAWYYPDFETKFRPTENV